MIVGILRGHYLKLFTFLRTGSNISDWNQYHSYLLWPVLMVNLIPFSPLSFKITKRSLALLDILRDYHVSNWQATLSPHSSVMSTAILLQAIKPSRWKPTSFLYIVGFSGKNDSDVLPLGGQVTAPIVLNTSDNYHQPQNPRTMPLRLPSTRSDLLDFRGKGRTFQFFFPFPLLIVQIFP